MIAEHAQSECARSMRAVRANSSAVPFEWVAEREKGKNMDRLSIFCRSLAGGAIIGIGVLIAQQAVAQESVSVRAQMVKGALPGEDPTAAAWNAITPSEFPMSPQVHWPTRILEVTAQSIKAGLTRRAASGYFVRICRSVGRSG